MGQMLLLAEATWSMPDPMSTPTNVRPDPNRGSVMKQLGHGRVTREHARFLVLPMAVRGQRCCAVQAEPPPYRQEPAGSLHCCHQALGLTCQVAGPAGSVDGVDRPPVLVAGQRLWRAPVRNIRGQVAHLAHTCDDRVRSPGTTKASEPRLPPQAAWCLPFGRAGDLMHFHQKSPARAVRRARQGCWRCGRSRRAAQHAGGLRVRAAEACKWEGLTKGSGARLVDDQVALLGVLVVGLQQVVAAPAHARERARRAARARVAAREGQQAPRQHGHREGGRHRQLQLACAAGDRGSRISRSCNCVCLPQGGRKDQRRTLLNHEHGQLEVGCRCLCSGKHLHTPAGGIPPGCTGPSDREWPTRCAGLWGASRVANTTGAAAAAAPAMPPVIHPPERSGKPSLAELSSTKAFPLQGYGLSAGSTPTACPRDGHLAQFDGEYPRWSLLSASSVPLLVSTSVQRACMPGEQTGRQRHWVGARRAMPISTVPAL